VTLLEVPEFPARPASNSLFPAAVARLVSAATVEATFVVAEAAVVLAELGRLERAPAWLPEMLLIDIMPMPVLT